MVEKALESLNPVTLPLNGIRLIEASAGTGKTYTITSLYLRLVLGHGCQPRPPENILVVTFTRAATEELRDRIRSRLKQAQKATQIYLDLNPQCTTKDNLDAQSALEIQQQVQDIDPLISEIIFDIADVGAALQRLKDAQQLMDMSSIYTIHGFCQRVLSQHAFEAGLSFENTLTLDEGPFIQQAVRDNWRQQVYPMSKPYLNWVLKRWPTPMALESEMRSFLHQKLMFDTGHWQGDIDTLFQHFNERHAALRSMWESQREQLKAGLLQNPLANGQFTRYLNTRFESIDRVVIHAEACQSSDADKLQYFTPAAWQKTVKKGGQPLEHDFPDVVEKWVDAYEAFISAQTKWLNQWFVKQIENTRQRLSDIKKRLQIMAPDDLLNSLNEALLADAHSHIHKHKHSHAHSYESSDAIGPLTQQLRQQFPVALVDEFQDTDSQQYAIFNRLYRHERDNTDLDQKDMPADAASDSLALFMIGDPKQAIYKFRGADIFTYIQAKRQVDGIYSLDTNYRSTASMVEAVNRIFTFAEAPFIFDKDIPFQPVKSIDKAPPLQLNAQPQSALSWQWLSVDAKENKSALDQRFASGAAEQIAQLLNDGAAGTATINDSPVQAKNIAILVRSGRQAELMKHALRERQISSVFVGRNSIFATEEALALFHFLEAVHEKNERLYRNAIAHPVWMFDLPYLKTLGDNEALWDDELERLSNSHVEWQRQGVMAMLMQWLHQKKLPQKWLQVANGERRLTNVLHLGELLQQASTDVQGMQGLLSWLGGQISQASGDQDQQQLRLESDANLVQIITLHKSKGLEYPIVFMPFLWDGKATRDRVFYNEETEQAQCDLTNEYGDRIQKEAMAEEIRLLYVGLTRAVNKCYIGIYGHADHRAKVNQFIQKSALGYVLTAPEPTNVELDEPSEEGSSMHQVLTQLNQGQLNTPYFDIQSIPDTVTLAHRQAIHKQLNAQRFKGKILSKWRLASFSSLMKSIGHSPTSNEDDVDSRAAGFLSHNIQSPRFERADESSNTVLRLELADNIPSSTDGNVSDEALNQFTFPRGAHAGNFMHSLLESIDFTAYALGDIAPDEFPTEEIKITTENLLNRYGFDESWAMPVHRWLANILTTALSIPIVAQQGAVIDSKDSVAAQDNPAVRLNQLHDQHKKVEMEFYFPVSKLVATEFNQLIEKYPCRVHLSAKYAPASFKTLQGMLKGFIDLIFEWQGRFYILDYKTNYLGDHLDEYHEPALHQAMMDHRYDVQLIIYTLALHRMLKLRLADYDYDQHIGGGHYVFLRGMKGENGFNTDFNAFALESEAIEGDIREPQPVMTHGGQFYYRPERELIESLDALIQEQSEAG